MVPEVGEVSKGGGGPNMEVVSRLRWFGRFLGHISPQKHQLDPPIDHAAGTKKFLLDPQMVFPYKLNPFLANLSAIFC